VNRPVRGQSADSGAVRSHRVPNLKAPLIAVAFWDKTGRLSGRDASIVNPCRGSPHDSAAFIVVANSSPGCGAPYQSGADI
jgi:hypothetical protein